MALDYEQIFKFVQASSGGTQRPMRTTSEQISTLRELRSTIDQFIDKLECALEMEKRRSNGQ